MNTTTLGQTAEAKAADYLKNMGYSILAQNWRTRYCEIDLVATKDKTVFFVEVKYRARQDFGSGLEYILPKKLQQMGFAAEMWVHDQQWTGAYQLAALEVSGPQFSITNFLTDL